MKPKTIVIAIVLALVAVILYYNKEESTFWLFGQVRTSKLIILGIFFLLGVVTGGIVFRRRKKHPKEYGISNPNIPEMSTTSAPEQSPYSASNLSDEDRDFIRRD